MSRQGMEHVSELETFSLDRRRFVQAGVAAAGLTCWPGVGWAGLQDRRALTVGVLYPQSRRYPALGAEWLAGMQAWAGQHSGEVALRFVPVQYGSRPSQARTALLDLLQERKLDVAAAFVCRNAAAQWTPELERHALPLLVCDAGANAVQSDAFSPWVARHSLGCWQANWAAGQWAARRLGRRAVVAVGALESGFDMLPAFTQGFAAGGGKVPQVQFTHLPDGRSQLPELRRLVQEQQPDLVYVLDSGQSAASLAAWWPQSGLEGRVPLVVGSTLADSQTPVSPGAWRVSAWDARLPGEANARFRAALTGVQPSAIHLLGYEAAQRLAAAGAGGWASASALASALAASALETPRGMVQGLPGGDIQAPAFISGGAHDAAPTPLDPVASSACTHVCGALASRVADTYLV